MFRTYLKPQNGCIQLTENVKSSTKNPSIFLDIFKYEKIDSTQNTQNTLKDKSS